MASSHSLIFINLFRMPEGTKLRHSRRRKKSSIPYIIIFLICSLIVIFGYTYLVGKRSFHQDSYQEDKFKNDKGIDHKIPEIEITPNSIPQAPLPGLKPKVAIVIDDIGNDYKIVQEFLRWNIPITFSILPFTPYSKAIAIECSRNGMDVILHLPMEPHGYPDINPGEGALLQEMDEEMLISQLSKNIEAVPFIKGVSNHMGSRMMEDHEKVKIILSELKRRGLFFLDSRTTPKTVGLRTANAIGLKAIERTIFLDHGSVSDIRENIEKLTRYTLSHGVAVAIGHPHTSTIRSLREMLLKIEEKDIDVVPLYKLFE